MRRRKGTETESVARASLPQIREAIVGAAEVAYPRTPAAERLLRFTTMDGVRGLLTEATAVAGSEHPAVAALARILEDRVLWDLDLAAALLGYADIGSFNASCFGERGAEFLIAQFVSERRDEFNVWLASRGFHSLQGTDLWLHTRNKLWAWIRDAKVISK